MQATSGPTTTSIMQKTKWVQTATAAPVFTDLISPGRGLCITDIKKCQKILGTGVLGENSLSDTIVFYFLLPFVRI